MINAVVYFSIKELLHNVYFIAMFKVLCYIYSSGGKPYLKSSQLRLMKRLNKRKKCKVCVEKSIFT